MKVKMKDSKAITIEAVKEALQFIDDMWGAWEGDLHMLISVGFYQPQPCSLGTQR